MNTTVWKFVLKPIGIQTIQLPKDSRILHVAQQYNEVYLWAMFTYEDHEDEIEYQPRRIRIYGTCDDIPGITSQEHIATVILNEGDLVLHVFEVLK